MKKYLVIILNLFFAFTLNAQQWEWARSGKGSGYDKANSLSADANGNLFVTGSFSSPTITFGSITLTNGNGGWDANAFIVKYDSNGNVLWAKNVGGAGEVTGTSLKADPGGNVFVTGGFSGSSILFDSIILSSAGNPDIFIAKYDANGNVLWVKQAGGTKLDYGTSVNTDASGNVFLTGCFVSDSIGFGNYSLINHSTTQYGPNIFIAKYDENGNVIWAKSAGGAGSYFSNSIGTDSIGSVFLTGSIGGFEMTFDSVTIVNAGGLDGFIVKYDSNGNALWAKSIGGPNTDYSTCLSVQGSGNVFITGYFGDSAIHFDSITLTNTTTGNYNFFIVKYNSNGNALWAKNAVGGIGSQGFSVSADVTGNVFVSGHFQSPPITFGSISLTPPPANCSFTNSPHCHPMFIVKYDANGNVLYGTSLASGNGSSVSTDPFGNAYIGGWFTAGPFIVSTDTLPLTGNQNVCVAKCAGDNSIAVSESGNEEYISLCPNPSTGKFIIESSEKISSLEIKNIFGERIYLAKIDSEKAEINLSKQPAGVYFVEVVCSDGRRTKKIILE